MTIKGYTQGYIVQYVVADLDGTVIDTFDDRETAEACAEEGQQIVELDGYGYVADIADANDLDGVFKDVGPIWNGGDEQPSLYTVADIEAANSLLPRFPWTRG